MAKEFAEVIRVKNLDGGRLSWMIHEGPMLSLSLNTEEEDRRMGGEKGWTHCCWFEDRGQRP